ncbi:dihydrofolate reductase family protein [Streptomyces niveus]|uniref:dihydrofolate reductase family protein n=1 Tax=Streptomyces niveus TaxID=193462 RepID=UPI00387006A9|nr:dihydrofolate reductase family protein [Streptomyces niveus]
MNLVTCRASISLDGFTAAPNQSLKNPFGEGGMSLPQWQFETEQEGRSADAEILRQAGEDVGAYIMGRRMFGPGTGEWDQEWTGWWGPNPPYHAPVFVLSHHPREPLTMEGGTTFTFVTDGIESALEQASKAAGDRKVVIAGGANVVRQYLAAGLIDELLLHIVPVTLGAGERLLKGVGGLKLNPVEVVASPTVTHVRYRLS